MAGDETPSEMDDEAVQVAVLADAMTDAMSVATRASLDDPEADEGAPTSAVSALLGDRASAKASRWARRTKERLEESRDRLRRVIEGEWDLKTTLAHRERKAVAGALACVAPGLNRDDDDAFSDLLRWFVVDALGLDEDSLLAVSPLATPPPTTVEEQIQRTTTAAGTFVGALAVAESLPGDDDPEDDHDPSSSDAAIHADDGDGNSRVNSVAGRLRERWTDVIGALMTAAVAAKRYDARCSAALRRLAAAADVRWSRVAALEDSLALHLKSILRSRRGAEGGAEGGGAEGGGAEGVAEVAMSSAMSPSVAKPQPTGGGQTGASDDVGWFSQLRNMSASRALSVTAAAAVGGSVLFITGGLAAPAVVASLASMGAAGGILGTAALSVGTLLAYFGGAGGISMIFGGVGAGLTGWRMLNRTSGLSQFAFLPVRGTGAGMSVYLFVPGFLRDPADLFRTWGASDGVYSVVLRLPSLNSDKKDRDEEGFRDKDDDDDVKGQLVAGLGMWLKRDPRTDDVFVSWIDPGGAADRAGVAEGSVLTALATRVEHKETSDDADDERGTDTRPAPRVRRVRGRGDDPNDRSLLRLSQVRAVLAGRDRTRSGDRLSEISPVEAAGAGGVVVAELWLRRNLAAGDDVEKIAKRRGLPKLRLFRRRAEAKRKAKLAQAMVGASEAEIIAGKVGAAPEEDNDEEEDDEEAGDDGNEDDEDEDDDDDDDDEEEDEEEDVKKGDVEARNEADPPSSPPPPAAAQHRWHRAGIDTLRSIGNGVASVASVVPFVGGTPGGEKRTPSGGGGDDSPEKTEDERRRDSAAAAAELAASWPLPNGEQHVVGWEHALLVELGLAMTSFAQDAVTSYAVGHGIGYTSLAGIAAAVTWPALLLKSSQFIDSPWALAIARAGDAGEALASALLERKQGMRPVTLVGYSVGCEAIARCCRVLANADGGKGAGLIDAVVLVGATLDTGVDTWGPIRAVACGRVVNAHVSGAAAANDWLLAFLYRANTQVLASVFNPTNVVGAAKGLAAWSTVAHPGVENVDVSDVCCQHTDIPDEMPRILTKCGMS